VIKNRVENGDEIYEKLDLFEDLIKQDIITNKI